MVAISPARSNKIAHDFVSMHDEIASRLRRRFRFLADGSCEDAVAEGVAQAWAAFRSAMLKGKSPTPGNLAYYAARAVRSGRRLCGSTNRDAVTESPVGLTRRASIAWEAVLCDPSTIRAIFGDRGCRHSPYDYVQPAIDIVHLLRHSDSRDQQIVAARMRGEDQKGIARRLGVTAAAICQRLRALRERYEAMTSPATT